MKSATLLERKRFAADLAERDAQRPARPRRLTRHTDQAQRTFRPDPSSVAAPELAPRDEEMLDRYRMRRWWLDRYTLDEIRALAECLR